MTIQTTYSQARANLAALMRRVLDDKDTVIITRRNGERVALIDADELESLEETAYLLRSPANARRLLEALARSRNGEGIPATMEDLRKRVSTSCKAATTTNSPIFKGINREARD